MEHNIFTIHDKKEERVLRMKTEDFDFKKFSAKETRELVQKMRKAMKQANGIGLSANQIGLSIKVFVGEIPSQDGEHKFYAIFNPKIDKIGKEKTTVEEGCLSVPGVYGPVERASQIVLSGFDKNANPIKIKAWGLLAKMFQHEVDHLNGMLFIDKAKELYTFSPPETPEPKKKP